MRMTALRAAIVTLLAFGAASIAESAGIRPQLLPNGGGPLKPARMPLALSKERVNVVVQLTGDPVALHEADAGRKLDKAEKEKLKSQLKSAQAQLHQHIERLGGQVVNQYQVSYNGIKVNIARNKTRELASLPGVVAVRTLQKMKPDNTHGPMLIGAPAVWGGIGLHGEGIKVGIIDTGIDYTHANFGGSGDPNDYAMAHAAETAAPNPAWFGPSAPRVKGGIDLVGDDYDAENQPVAHPDSNPLDCNGHGSHVAGTAAGSGVTSDGKTYTGLYTNGTITGASWNVGPGVAPMADLYAIRVFGCDGSTEVTVDAIEWAVDNGMDVINMSLGSPFGSRDDPAAEAATNAVRAGVLVVTSAGNQGTNPYLTGSPGTAEGSIATAANESLDAFPGALLTMAGGPLIAINANDGAFTNGTSFPIAVIRNSYPSGTVALGCAQDEYDGYVAAHGPGSLMGRMVVTLRGTCSRVARAIFAQMNGAAASLMINNAAAYPPFEGPITSSAETGPYTVTIPFFGVRGTDSAVVIANDDASTIGASLTVPNPNYTGFASFSSGGPRTGDSFLKPDITAPGVSIVSTLSGGGALGTILSGTSMASPHVAGVAALTRQAHPTWGVRDLRAAIVNTGSPSGVAAYRTARGGTGLVQPVAATATSVVAHGDGGRFPLALNFGFEEFDRDLMVQKKITLDNNGSANATFTVTQSLPGGRAHSIAFDRSTVTVPAGGSADVFVTLTVPIATVANSDAFREVAGLVLFTPASASDNANVALRVPYYLVPRALSDVSTQVGSLSGTNPSAGARIINSGGRAGDADFYAWGLAGARQPGRFSNDVRAIGVQSFPAAEVIGTDAQPDEQLIVFAVNTRNRWSNASQNEFDIYVDVDGDGVDDYIVVGADNGALTAGDFDGTMLTAVFSLRSDNADAFFLATAPTDSSTALLPILTRQLCMDAAYCLSRANPRLRYRAIGFDLLNEAADDVVPGEAKFNPWTNAISTGGFTTVAPGGTDTSVRISINSAEWGQTPARGLMVVTLDNKAGAGEAQLIGIKPEP